MILIYTEHISERLSYICHFIFKEQLGIEYNISDKIADINEEYTLIINYSNDQINLARIHIKPLGLLFEEEIKKQGIICHHKNGYPTFFDTQNDDLGFDLFSAAFYLISRYEEYLPHQTDIYGRYDYRESIAYKNNFIDLPLVNIWIDILANKIKATLPSIVLHQPPFKTLVSYDVDMAWSYKNKGLVRGLGGLILKPCLKRLRVLLGLSKDPFDCFDFIQEKNKKNKLETIYFFLVAQKISKYDKNSSPNKKPMRKLIQQIAEQNNIGLHPSWRSNSNIEVLKKEKVILEAISNKFILNSRQHYIKFNLPETYSALINSGISNDFSMGYGSINGFRASVASSFFWFDLKENKTTSLRLYPFCFMDATSHYSLKHSAEEGLKQLLYYKDICQKVNGLFIPIFHNTIIGDEAEFKGWKETYATFTDSL